MLPIGDRNPSRTTPFVNYALLALNAVAFLAQSWVMLTGGEAWVVPGYGLVATRFLFDPLGEAFTLFSSMFMHGGWVHLGFNMLFLYIFGDNVEDAIGHRRYLLFYLACGVVAGLSQVAIDTSSPVPMVGASGAIAGVLGAYLVLYPRAPITVVNPIPLLWLFFGLFLELPAWIVAGEWFVMNLFSGVQSLSGMAQTGGVAFFAHLGGFVAGLLLVRPLLAGRERRDHRRWQGFRVPERRLRRY
jgi:membrane associated rhomboid family serine protease